MNGGYYSKYREITKQIRKNRNARDIFDYLCEAAAWAPYPTKVKNATYTLQIGELISSASKIAEETSWTENRKLCTYTVSEIKMALAFLEKLKIIKMEQLPVKIHGTKITVMCYTTAEQQPENSLQPQGIDGYQQPETWEPQPIPQPIPQPVPTLQPEGMKQDLQPVPQPVPQPTFFKKELKEKELKEKDLKEQQKISQSESIVNTFSQAFKYILSRFENEFLMDRLEANKSQIAAIREFAQQMDLDLLTILFNEAAEGTTKNPAAYFIKICRESLTKGITTLDKKKQYASQYRQRTGTDGRQQQTGRQLSPRDTSGNFDNLPF
jgi:hypothetical protein